MYQLRNYWLLSAHLLRLLLLLLARSVLRHRLVVGLTPLPVKRIDEGKISELFQIV